KEAENNVAGLYARTEDKQTNEKHEGILWGGEHYVNYAWTVSSGGKTWAIDLRKKRYKMPFLIVLDKFTRELHPHTNTPKGFMSEVTRIEGDTTERSRIEMNEPLRREGLVLFQSGWGPPEAGPSDRMFSIFSV